MREEIRFNGEPHSTEYLGGFKFFKAIGNLVTAPVNKLTKGEFCDSSVQIKGINSKINQQRALLTQKEKELKLLESGKSVAEFKALINSAVALKKDVEILKIKKNSLLINAKKWGVDTGIMPDKTADSLGGGGFGCIDSDRSLANAIRKLSNISEQVGDTEGKIEYYKNFSQKGNSAERDLLNIGAEKNRLLGEISNLKEAIQKQVQLNNSDKIISSKGINNKAISSKDNIPVILGIFAAVIIVYKKKNIKS